MTAPNFDIDALTAPALEAVPEKYQAHAAQLWRETARTLTAIADAASNAADADHPDSDGNVLSASELQALGQLCRELRSFLFTSTIRIMRPDESTPSRSYPIHFIEIEALTEFNAYLAPPITPAHVRNGVGWDSSVTTEFVRQWIISTEQRYPTGVGVFDLPRGEIFVDAPGSSTSAKSALTLWHQELRRIHQTFENALAIAPELQVVRDAADRVEKVAKSVEQTAGKVGSDSLAAYFAELATVEERNARNWSAIAIASLVTITTIAVVVLVAGAKNDNDWTEQLLHLALTLPFAALAAYASAVASRHRHQNWWARTTAAQLHTIGPYVEPLSESGRSHVLEQVGL